MKIEGIVEYNISDIFIPLKQTRHLPKIFSNRDIVIRDYETGINSLITATQYILYTSLFKLVSD